MRDVVLKEAQRRALRADAYGLGRTLGGAVDGEGQLEPEACRWAGEAAFGFRVGVST